MELVKGIRERRSIRKFKDMFVPHDVIEEMIETASFAPSWKNTQIARYIVVEDKEKIKAIAWDECMMGFSYNMKTLSQAPAVVILTMIKGRSGYERDGSFSTPKGDRWEMFDAGIAAQTFCLAAHEKGLGTVIVGVFDESKISDIVKIPEGQQIAAIIPIGYPDIEPDAPKRKSVSELVSFI